MALGRFLVPALENEANGKTGTELEHAFWVKLNGISQLHKAVKAVKQRQVQVKVEKTDSNFAGGIIRVRETEDTSKNVTYELTVKQEHEGTETRTEVTIPATRDIFVQVAGLAEDMVVKHRYYFETDTPGRYWEVDAAPDGQGGYYEWARVELEVDDMNTPLPAMPFSTTEAIFSHLSNPEGLDDEEWEKRDKELYRVYFVKKGPLVGYTDHTDDTDTVAKDAQNDPGTEQKEEPETNGEA